jgi:uncharacterized membrane protein
MLRLAIGSVIIGVLVFLLIFFISPLIISESEIVSIVAEFALSLSNLFFDNMPPIIASYIASLNLAIAAFTMGLFLTLVIQLLGLVSSLFIGITKRIISYIQKDRKNDEALDLPPIDMDSTFTSSATGKNILGRGLDSIDQD